MEHEQLPGVHLGALETQRRHQAIHSMSLYRILTRIIFSVKELHRLSKRTRYRVPSQVENDRAQESTEPVSYSAPEHVWIPA
jgi:hypothetical protein